MAKLKATPKNFAEALNAFDSFKFDESSLNIGVTR